MDQRYMFEENEAQQFPFKYEDLFTQNLHIVFI